MLKKLSIVLFLSSVLIFGQTSCSKPSVPAAELKHYPLDTLDGVLKPNAVEVDKTTTSDSNGSFKIVAKEPVTVELYDVGDIDVENATLTYQAKVKTEGVEGQVYLEMWCYFPEKGQFFSRGLQFPLSGTTDWTTLETNFYLKKGENPDNVRLNVVINGKGTVWVDDIHLLQGPLKE
jgi:hypothetical protein